jgi:hypothetical protein
MNKEIKCVRKSAVFVISGSGVRVRSLVQIHKNVGCRKGTVPVPERYHTGTCAGRVLYLCRKGTVSVPERYGICAGKVRYLCRTGSVQWGKPSIIPVIHFGTALNTQLLY